MSTAIAQDRVGEPEVHDAFLRGRFLPAPQPMPLVRRRRLLDLLTAAAAGPLTLISAPAGAGKTVLVSDWVASGSAPGPVAWVSLDADVDVPGAFWFDVLTGFGSAGVDVSTEGAGQRPDLAGRDLAVRIATALANRPTPLVLVLDGAEHLTSPRLLAELDFVLRHAPDALRVVLCSRRDPQLALSRRRLERTLTEIRFDDLAFTDEEADELVAGRDPSLAPEEVASIRRLAGGWAAALCLLSTERRPPSAGGWEASDVLTSTELAGYFRAEVLPGFSAPEQELLLTTSAVEHVTPELAAHLSGLREAGAALRALAQPRAFVRATDEDGGGGYVILPLVRDLLQGKLLHDSPSRYRRIQRRAGIELAAAGRSEEATRSFGLAGAWEEAATALVDGALVGALLASDPDDELAALFARMPAATPGRCAAVVRAAVAVIGEDLSGCDAGLQAADAAAGAPPTPRYELALALVHGCRAALAGEDGLAAVDAAARAFASSGIAALSRPETPALIHLDAGASHLLAGRLQTARSAFAAAAGTPGAGRRPGLQARSFGALALAEALLGNLTASVESAGLARALREPGAPPSADGELAAAWVALERSDLAGARKHADLVEPEHGAVTAVSRALLVSVRTALRTADGDRIGALTDLDAFLGSARSIGVPVWTAARLDADRVGLLVRAGRPGAAAEAIAASAEAAAREPAMVLARARNRLSAGRPAEAARTSRRVAADPALPLDQRVRALLLVAASAQASAHVSTAIAAVDEALTLAGPERLRAPFDDAPELVQLLVSERIGRAQPPSPPMWASSAPAPARPPAAQPESPAAARGDEAALVEPLTPRELEVLRCLDALMPTEEIARTLYVSVNTVKTHVRAILRKLSADRRYEAVRRARSLGLI
jgi:LuxR family maltose regulon positive regulatory protein